MNPNKIKQVRRVGIPETNSSSSHTLTIFSGDMLTIDEVAAEGILSDDRKTLTIPGGADEEFGRNNDDFNDIVHKLQYVTARIEDYPERKALLEKVLKDYLGVENIIYDWYDDEAVEKWFDEHPSESDCPLYHRPDGTDMPCPNMVDHESFYLIDDNICESEDTLRDFLFSPNSWIFSGEEEVTEPKDKFPMRMKGNKGIFLTFDPQEKNADPTGSIGKIDIHLYNYFPYDIYRPILNTNPQYWRGSDYPWIKVLTDEESWINSQEIKKLESLWIFREETGDLRLEVGNIEKAIESAKNLKQMERVYVPEITPETFKYPFTLEFIDINEYASSLPNFQKSVRVAGIPLSIPFNLKLSSPEISINEYV